MPEGPEIKIISEQLNEFCKEKILIGISWTNSSRYSKVKLKGYDLFEKYSPYKIKRVFSKGKQIFMELISIYDDITIGGAVTSGSFFLPRPRTIYLNSNFGFKGKWLLKKGSHSDLSLELGSVHESSKLIMLKINEYIYYDDSIKHGNISILSEDDFQKKIKSLGPDLIVDDISTSEWRKKIRKTKQRIKIYKFLMNQTKFSGIGNYLQIEILYLAKIKPTRDLESLSDIDLENIRKYSISTIRKSYSLGGTYTDLYDKKGTFKVKIYRKKVDEFGNKIMKTKLDRTVYWVPSIQK